jgi:transposase
MPPGITEEIIARQPPEAQVIIRLLLAEIAELKARIAQLERQVSGKTPQNSSLPPSTQHPHARPQPRGRRSKKKRGGQPGHDKHERPLIPTDECDDVQRLKPTECRRCGTKLVGSDPEPLRHQVWELPEIKPEVIEYQRHRLTCPRCGETTCAELPVGVPQGQSGPRLMALTALLMAFYRQSKRRTADFLGALLGQPCCPALTVKIQNQVTEALRPTYETLATELPAHARGHGVGNVLDREVSGHRYL